MQGLTVLEQAKSHQDNTLQRWDIVDEIVSGGAHYNFTKTHLISHFTKQIPKFSTWPQYSIHISKYMYRAFKVVYRRSNKFDSLSQIVTTYTKDHTFAIKDLTIRVWKCIRQQVDTIACVGEKPTGSQGKLKVLGKTNLLLSLRDLEYESGVRDVRLDMSAFFMRELRDTNSDIKRLLDHEIVAYGALRIPVPKLSTGFV